MGDKEIIKALACCFVEESCSKCPWYIDCKSDVLESIPYGLGRAAFDLINRQKAEIEDKAEKLRKVLPIVAELKAEAIKEFAERLKKNEGRRGVPIATIDNLVKEMTEDQHSNIDKIK